MEVSRLGVVVIGVGIAGRVRIRDLLKCEDFEGTKRAKLIGYVSRRQVDIEGATAITLEDAITRKDVHILMICTENEKHEEIARRGIEGGKHVLVEFPIALSATKARELYTLAEKYDVVLYEEDISLLTDVFKEVQQIVKEKPNMTEGTVTLEGTFNRWNEDIEKSGSGFHSSVSILHRLVTLWPDVQATDACIVCKDNSWSTQATVTRAMNGGVITIDITRETSDKPKRSVKFMYKFADGSHVDTNSVSPYKPPAPGQPGLFMKDFIQFLRIVNKELDNAAFKETTIKGLELADDLFTMAKNNSKSQLGNKSL